MEGIKVGQIKGPFNKNVNLVYNMDETFSISKNYIVQIGIQGKSGDIIILNEQEYEIGNTGLYEQMNTNIISVVFKQDVDEQTLIEYIILTK